MLDTEEFQRGRQGEREVAHWLRRRGWYVIPSYDYAGENGDKAPKMEGNLNSFAIPDLDLCKAGKRVWCEVKTKRQATVYRKTGVAEHGISYRLWNGYRSVERESGSTVWILVLEETTGELLCQSLQNLGAPRIYVGDKMGRGGMAFWPRNKFRFVCRLRRAGP